MSAGLPFLQLPLFRSLSFDFIQDIKVAFANALSSTVDVGGFVAGLFIVSVIAIVAGLLIGRDSPLVAAMLTMAGVGFVAVIGYWPWWILILVVIFLAWSFVSKIEFFSTKG